MQQEQDTISMAFGVISYLRCLFSDESFQDCKFNEMNLKTLKNTSETRKMMEWIANINRNKESIHKIVIGVYSISEIKGEQNGNIKEVNKDSSNNNITSNAINATALTNINNSSNETLVEMYSFNTDIQLDFKTVCRTLQGMKILRGKYTVKLKVYTTLFIEIPGFKRTNKLWQSHNLQEMNLDGFRIFKNEVEIKETPKIELKPATIACSCTINTDEKEMILCKKCNHWVHASCHGYFSSKDKRIKIEFICFTCMNLQSRELRDCSIYRRALSLVFNEEIPGDKENKTKENLKDFLKFRLGISIFFINKLISKLVADGFLSILNNKIRIIKTREIKEKIKHYFNGRKMECLISMCEISCEI